MAQDFHCRPSEFYGLHLHDDHAWLAYAIDRAVWTFGSFIHHRQEEMVERDAPPRAKGERPKVHEPKYTHEQLMAMIYGPLPDATLPATDGTAGSMPFLNVDPSTLVDDPEPPRGLRR